MSSEKPPTGTRHVPVTNCSSRALRLLSISRSNCEHEACYTEHELPTQACLPEHVPGKVLWILSKKSSGINGWVRLVPESSTCVGTNLPEPRNDLAILVVVAVCGMFLPVVDIDLLHAAQQQLQLPLIEVFEPLKRHDFAEALQEVLCLRLLATCQTPLETKMKFIKLITK